MEGTSTFAQMEASARSGWRGAATQVFGALEGAAAAIPTSLGCALIVFGRVAPDLVANGVFATMLGLVAIHLLTAGSTRPVCFAARIFEATTLAAMIEQLAPQLAGWGLEDVDGWGELAQWLDHHAQPAAAPFADRTDGAGGARRRRRRVLAVGHSRLAEPSGSLRERSCML